MKNLKTFGQFHEDNVQEGIKDYLLGGLATLGSFATQPQQAYGQTPKEAQVRQVDPTKKDLVGRPLMSAPSLKPEKIDKYKHLQTTKIVNPTPEDDARLKGKGWTPVWTDTSDVKTEWGVRKGVRKPSVEIKSNNDKFFELGGYRLTEEIKEKIKHRVDSMSVSLDSIEIESSTDKTPVTPKLKKDLESKGYSQDNQGLSKARSNSIKSFLVSLGIDGAKIKEVNLAEQGKEGGYDPSARYAKLTFTFKEEGSASGDEYFDAKKGVTVYYQKITGKKQKLGKQRYGEFMDCEDGKCPTYD